MSPAKTTPAADSLGEIATLRIELKDTGNLRRLRLFGQHGGLAKVGSDSDYAASLRSGLALSGASPG